MPTDSGLIPRPPTPDQIRALHPMATRVCRRCGGATPLSFALPFHHPHCDRDLVDIGSWAIERPSGGWGAYRSDEEEAFERAVARLPVMDMGCRDEVDRRHRRWCRRCGASAVDGEHFEHVRECPAIGTAPADWLIDFDPDTLARPVVDRRSRTAPHGEGLATSTTPLRGLAAEWPTLPPAVLRARKERVGLLDGLRIDDGQRSVFASRAHKSIRSIREQGFRVAVDPAVPSGHVVVCYVPARDFSGDPQLHEDFLAADNGMGC